MKWKNATFVLNFVSFFASPSSFIQIWRKKPEVDPSTPWKFIPAEILTRNVSKLHALHCSFQRKCYSPRFREILIWICYIRFVNKQRLTMKSHKQICGCEDEGGSKVTRSIIFLNRTCTFWTQYIMKIVFCICISWFI